jgi:hypothetical protein
MKQASLELNLSAKKTRKREFLEKMERVVPWSALVALIAPYYPEARTGQPPFALETMLRKHFLQQWFSLSDPAMENTFFDTPLYREFAQMDAHGRLPDERSILRFCHLLEKPQDGQRHPGQHQSFAERARLDAKERQRSGRHTDCRAAQRLDQERSGVSPVQHAGPGKDKSRVQARLPGAQSAQNGLDAGELINEAHLYCKSHALEPD